jgi:hypothetical protein
MHGLTLTRLSTCPSDKEVTENVVLFDARKHYTKLNALLFPYHYYRESNKWCYPLPIGYLFKPVSKALYLTRFSKYKNVYVLCSCRTQSLPYCWLQMIYNWANNSQTSKGYEQNVQTWLHAALTLISNQAHILTTAQSVNTVQFNKWHGSIYGNGLFAYRPTAALIVYAALVCVEYGLSSLFKKNDFTFI